MVFGPAWIKELGLFMTASCVVVSNDAPTIVKAVARVAKVALGNRIQVCNGVADDVEMQAAFGALPAGGGKVLVLEGGFAISARLLVPSNTTFAGCGPSTVLTLDNEVNDRFIVNSDRVGGNTNIVIEDLYIDGNNTGQTAIGPTDVHANAGCLDFMRVTNLVVRNNTIVNAWACGVETAYCTYVKVEGNRIDHSSDDGIGLNDHTAYATAYGNIITDPGQVAPYGGPCGIEVQDSAHDVSVTGNIIYNTLSSGIEVSTHVGGGGCYNVTIGNNVLDSCGFQGMYIGDRGENGHTFIVDGNTITSTSGPGIIVAATTPYTLIVNNIIRDSDNIGIAVYSTGTWILSNIIADTGSGDQDYGIYFYGTSNGCRAAGNRLTGNVIAPIFDVGTGNVVSEPEQNIFMDVLAASANYVGAWAGTGAEQVIVAGITQPDVPRNLSVACTNIAAPAGDVVIVGVDAKGLAVTETFTIVPAGTATGNEAFATITSITIPAGVTAADTVSVGIGSKLGLSNVIWAVGEVYKVKRNNADYPPASYTANATYHTVDMSPGAGIVGGDDYTCWYKRSLNVLS